MPEWEKKNFYLADHLKTEELNFVLMISSVKLTSFNTLPLFTVYPNVLGPFVCSKLKNHRSTRQIHRSHFSIIK